MMPEKVYIMSTVVLLNDRLNRLLSTQLLKTCTIHRSLSSIGDVLSEVQYPLFMPSEEEILNDT